jgi:hypothetical protein
MTDRELCGRMLGDIVVCERLNEGGHGIVYRGEQRLLGATWPSRCCTNG